MKTAWKLGVAAALVSPLCEREAYQAVQLNPEGEAARLARSMYYGDLATMQALLGDERGAFDTIDELAQ